jgi:hypothetical protein
MEPGGVHTDAPAAVCTPGSAGLHTRMAGLHTQLTPHAHPPSHPDADRPVSLPASRCGAGAVGTAGGLHKIVRREHRKESLM